MSNVGKSLKALTKETVGPFGYKPAKGSTPRFELTENHITRNIFLRKVTGNWLVQLMISLKPVPNEFPDKAMLVCYYLNPDGVVYSDWGYHKLWSLDDSEGICAAIKAFGLPFLDEIGRPASLYSFLKRLAFDGHPEAPERSEELGELGKLLESEMEWAKPSGKGVPVALLHLSLLCERLGNYEEAHHYAMKYQEWLMPFESALWQPSKDQLKGLLERLSSRTPPIAE